MKTFHWKKTASNSLDRLLLMIVLFVCGIQANAQDTGLMKAQFVNGENGFGIPNVHVSLDREPVDGVAELAAITNPLGLISKDLLPGTYQVTMVAPVIPDVEFDPITVIAGESTYKRYRLDLGAEPPETSFSLSFQVQGVVSQSSLPGATIKIMRRETADVGESSITESGVTNEMGMAELNRMTQGFYQFEITKPGWETYLFPDTPVELNSAQGIMASLKPIRGPLSVTVRGIEPKTEEPRDREELIKNALVEVTGLSFADPEIETIPVKQGYTDEAGNIVFPKLTPIPWRVQVKKPGYATVTGIIQPNETEGTLPSQNVLLPLYLDTAAGIRLTTDNSELQAAIDEPFIELDAQLEGIPGTITEGIVRRLRPLTLVNELIPGRYEAKVNWVRVTSNGVRVRFSGACAQFELDERETRMIDLKVTPIPARVRGQLLVTRDAVEGPLGVPASTYPIIAEQLEFRKGGSDGTFPEITRTIATDDNGIFELELEAGRYTLSIPDLEGYSERYCTLRFHDSTQDLEPDLTGQNIPWPREEFPLYLASGGDHQIDLVIAKNSIHVKPRVIFGAPFSCTAAGTCRTETYEDYASNAGIQIPWQALDSTEFRLTGPVNRTARIETELPLGDMRLVFEDVPAGTYQFSAEGSRYFNFTDASETKSSVDVVVPRWSSYPGALDGDDDAPTAGKEHTLGETLYGILGYPRESAPSLQIYRWNEDQQRYGDPTPGPAAWVDAASLPDHPDIIWRQNREKTPVGIIPSLPGLILYTRAGDGRWRTFDYTNSTDPLHLYIGGPEDTGGDFPGSKIQFRFRAFLKGGNEITGITWTNGAETRVSGAEFEEASLDLVFGNFTDNPFQGMIEIPFRPIGSRIQMIGTTPLKAEAVVTIVRDMELSGSVEDDKGRTMSDVPIRVFDRRNNLVISDLVTDAEGGFRSALAARGDPVFIEIKPRGYKPFKKLYTPTSRTADLTGIQIELDPLPEPLVSEIKLNRFGLFIPGVTKSGDFTGYNTDIAREVLTGRWETMAEAQSFNYVIEDIDETDSVSPTTIQAEDRLSEVWFVDRRAYGGPPTSDQLREGDVFASIDRSSPADVLDLLAAIEFGSREDAPFNVYHRKMRVNEEASDNQYSGTFFVPDLPVGLFEPMIVAVTERGAIKVAEYQYPEAAMILEGWETPSWLSNGILNTIGTLNTLRVKGGDVRDTFPSGSFVPLPDFSGRITLLPRSGGVGQVDDFTQEGYIRYSFSIGVISKIGANTPQVGSALSLGAAKVGVEMGGSLGLTANGKDKDVEVTIKGVLNKEFAESRSMDKPAFALKSFNKGLLKKVGDIKLRAEGEESFKFKATVSEINELFTITQVQRGYYEFEIVFNLLEKALMVGVPYAGPAILALDQLDVEIPIKLLLGIKAGAGTEQIYSWQTVQPRPLNEINSTTSLEPARLHFLGSEENRVLSNEDGRLTPPSGGSGILAPSNRTDILFASAVNLKAVIGKDTGFGIGGFASGLLELASPPSAPDRGVRVKMQPSANGSPLLEVVGSVNGGFDWKVNLVGLQYSAQHRWELLPFKWEFGTEPIYAIYPLPQIKVDTPATVEQARWIGESGSVVEGLYDAGPFDVSEQGSPALVYTQTDPTDGSMDLMVSVKHQGKFQEPVRVAETRGVISVAISPMPSEHSSTGWMLVWSEIESADLGNPMAASKLRYAISTDETALTWNEPVTMVEMAHPALKLDLKSNANRLFLMWMEAKNGVLVEEADVRVSMFTENGWSSSTTIFPASAGFVDYQFATSESLSAQRFAFTALHRDGWVFGSENIGGSWDPSPLSQYAERHSGLPALCYDREGDLWRVVHVPSEDVLLIFRKNVDDWIEVARVEDVASADKIRAAMVESGGADVLSITWLDESGTQVWHAWIARDGEMIRPPSIVETTEGAVVGRLFLTSDGQREGDANLLYLTREPTGSALGSALLSPLEPVELPELMIHYDHLADQLTLTWDDPAGLYILERNAPLDNGWDSNGWQVVEELTGEPAVSPFNISPEGRRGFFRLRQE